MIISALLYSINAAMIIGTKASTSRAGRVALMYLYFARDKFCLI